jgi:hypothetical protein
MHQLCTCATEDRKLFDLVVVDDQRVINEFVGKAGIGTTVKVPQGAAGAGSVACRTVRRLTFWAYRLAAAVCAFGAPLLLCYNDAGTGPGFPYVA